MSINDCGCACGERARSFRTERDELRERVTELQTLGSKHVIERQEMRARAEAAEKELSDQSEMRSNFGAELRRLHAKIDEAEADYAELMRSYNVELAKRKAAEALATSQTITADRWQARAEAAEKERDEQECRADAAEKERDDWKRCRDGAWQQRIETLRQRERAERAENECDEWKARAKWSADERDSAERAITAQRELILSLRNQIRAVRECIDPIGVEDGRE
jgi:chromosome segregation ATPase